MALPLSYGHTQAHFFHFGCVHTRADGLAAVRVLSLHMGRDPVHIPPCRSRGCERRWCMGTPEVERTSDACASMPATSCEVCSRPEPAPPRGNLLKNIYRPKRRGAWRDDHKGKEARILANPGLL